MTLPGNLAQTSRGRRRSVELIIAEILGPDLLVVLAVVALLFGSKQLPKLARSLGAAKSEFEKGLRQGEQGRHDTDEQVTMSRAELEALIAQRAEQAGKNAPPAS